MARNILVNGDSHPARLASFVLTESARNGEVGTGGIDFDDEAAGYYINPHWDISVEEDDAVGMLFVGYVGDKDIKRGPFAVDSDRQFDLNLVDVNTLLGDRIIRSGSNRPAETDIVRATWVLGTSYAAGLIGNIGATGAVSMDANDYTHQYVRDVLSDCAEMAGKMFFAYWDAAAGFGKVFYDIATANNYRSTARLTSVLADVDDTVTFAVRRETLHRSLDGGRIYSSVDVRYNGGSVRVTNATTEADYRERDISIFDDRTKTAAGATVRGTQFLAASASEEEVIYAEVDLTSAQAQLIRPGQAILVKFPHLGIPTYEYRRIVRLERRPRGDGELVNFRDYRYALELSMPKTTRWRDRGPTPEETLQEPSGGGPAAPVAAGTGGACTGTPEPHYVFRQLDSVGAYTEGVSGVVSATHAFGTSVYYNIAYDVAGCAIGGGAWVGYYDEDMWFQFTAPADVSTYLGLLVTLDASAVGVEGYTAGYEVRIYPGAPAGGRFGLGTPIAVGPLSGTVTIYIPRSAITWGAVNSLVLHPAWLCARDGFTCNAGTYYGSPLDDGRLQSGQYSNLGVSALCAAIFASGTTGMAPWVAGYGAVDGSNRTFTLIGWTGAGPVSYTINGLEQSTSGMVLTPTTVTLDAAPSSGSIVLFSYPVSVP